MKYFKVINPRDKLPEKGKWQGITCDPSLKYELYVFVAKPIPSFEEVWQQYFSTLSKSERIGCSSMLYFIYYKELFQRIKNIMSKPFTEKNDLWKIRYFKKKSLLNWIDFIKYSDDTMYEQNHLFKEIFKMIGDK